MASIPPLFPPLLILAAIASYTVGHGLAAIWLPGAFVLPQILSAALHAAWILLALRQTVGLSCIGLWLLAATFSSRGCSSVVAALLLESSTLALAIALGDPCPWHERLARWRRARNAIAVQLELSSGWIPWLRTTIRQAFIGSPVRATVSGFQRFAAELADVEAGLDANLRTLVLPEHLRETVRSRAAELLSRAEAESLRISLELEHQALTAASECRDECEQLTGMTPQRREQIADECEALFLGLLRRRT